MNLRDQKGASHRLETILGKGGEAAIYAVSSSPQAVAKIYFTHSAERTRKLQAMVAHPPVDPTYAQGHVSICWPQSMLFDTGSQCVGFLMPRLDRSRHRELFKLYNPMDRASEAPGFTWAYLLKTAENIAIVMESIHARGYVIGDVNESNFFVSDQALVTLVDCDSMQVHTPSETFLCPVGKAEYLAPELQGVHLATTPRTRAHDDFSLAVLLFLLLMEGFHPYSGVWKAAGDAPPLESRIATGDSPYANPSRVKPSPLAPPFASLPKALQQLFTRAFTTGSPAHPPNAREWHAALAEVSQHLTPCKQNRKHVYSQELSRCPWCERSKLLGADPFPLEAKQRPLKPKPFAAGSTPPSPRNAPLWRSTATRPSPLAAQLPRLRPALVNLRHKAAIGLAPFLSALASIAVLNLLNPGLRWRFVTATIAIAGLFGLLLNLRRRLFFRSLASAGLCLVAIYLSALRSVTLPLALCAAPAAFFATRSLLLQLRRRLDHLRFQGRSRIAFALLAASIAATPALGYVAALASTTNLPGTLAGAFGPPGTRRLPQPSQLRITTCIQIQGACGCTPASTFTGGEEVAILVTASLRSNAQLTLTLPGTRPRILPWSRPWQSQPTQSCRTAHLRLPRQTPPGSAFLQFSPQPPNLWSPKASTSFTIQSSPAPAQRPGH